jgi:hypothetical protein
LLRGIEDPLHRQAEYWRLYQLEYSFGATQEALENFLVTQKELAAERDFDGLWVPGSNRLGYLIDAYFDSSVRTQNSVIPFLRRRYSGAGVPKSLRTLLTKSEKRDYAPSANIPEKVMECLREYWRISGERVRGYRDLIQHYAIGASPPAFGKAGIGELGVEVFLPDDPSTRGEGDITFDKEIHAYPFMRKALGHLLVMCYDITKQILLVEKGRANQLVMAPIRKPITLGGTRKLARLVEPADLRRWLEDLSGRLTSNS